MSPDLKKRIVILFCLVAGSMDACTGLLLMSVPDMALGLMRVAIPDLQALVFVRFIGAFVFSVGALYLFGGLIDRRYRWSQYIRPMLLMTAWVRAVVFVFATSAIVSGALPTMWVSVPIADGSLAIIQIWVVLSGWVSVNE